MSVYMIYQKTNVDSDRINSMPTSVYAKAYFALGMPTRDNVEDAVHDGLHHNMYQPTMIMHDVEVRERTPFEAIFDEGNGYGDGSIKTANIRDRSKYVRRRYTHGLDKWLCSCMYANRLA